VTALLLFCLAGGCWLPIGWAVDHYDLYPEHWLADAAAALLALAAALAHFRSHR
jgi:hypothetical protein